MSSFRSDLKAAEITEEDVAGMLVHSVINAVCHEKVLDEVRSLYDYSVTVGRRANAVQYLFEIKDDLKSGETGNFAVEKARWNKDGDYEKTGINVTTADYWAIKIWKTGVEGVYLIPTAVLRHFIMFEDNRLVEGGDDKRTHMYLFDVVLLVEHGLRLDLAAKDSIVLRKFSRIAPPDKRHYK